MLANELQTFRIHSQPDVVITRPRSDRPGLVLATADKGALGHRVNQGTFDRTQAILPFAAAVFLKFHRLRVMHQRQGRRALGGRHEYVRASACLCVAAGASSFMITRRCAPESL